MANIQIDISENGKTTLDTKGKFCEDYIDINVEVPVKPTQFVNVLEYADAFIFNQGYDGTGNGYVTSRTNGFIGVTLNLDKLPGGNPLKRDLNEIRFRGCGHPDSNFSQSEDGETYAAKGLSAEVARVDQYGDMVFQRGWIDMSYVRFNIIFAGFQTSGNIVLPDDFDPVAAGCIVTFNEPIGNGGHTG